MPLGTRATLTSADAHYTADGHVGAVTLTQGVAQRACVPTSLYYAAAPHYDAVTTRRPTGCIAIALVGSSSILEIIYTYLTHTYYRPPHQTAPLCSRHDHMMRKSSSSRPEHRLGRRLRGVAVAARWCSVARRHRHRHPEFPVVEKGATEKLTIASRCCPASCVLSVAAVTSPVPCIAPTTGPKTAAADGGEAGRVAAGAGPSCAARALADERAQVWRRVGLAAVAVVHRDELLLSGIG